MAGVNWLDIVFEIWDKIVSLLSVLWDFIFQNVTIDLPEWLNDLLGVPDITFGVWSALGGVGIVAIILWGVFN